jgi:hypothetical protein
MGQIRLKLLGYLPRVGLAVELKRARPVKATPLSSGEEPDAQGAQREADHVVRAQDQDGGHHIDPIVWTPLHSFTRTLGGKLSLAGSSLRNSIIQFTAWTAKSGHLRPQRQFLTVCLVTPRAAASFPSERPRFF